MFRRVGAVEVSPLLESHRAIFGPDTKSNSETSKDQSRVEVLIEQAAIARHEFRIRVEPRSVRRARLPCIFHHKPHGIPSQTDPPFSCDDSDSSSSKNRGEGGVPPLEHYLRKSRSQKLDQTPSQPFRK